VSIHLYIREIQGLELTMYLYVTLLQIAGISKIDEFRIPMEKLYTSADLIEFAEIKTIDCYEQIYVMLSHQ
jgi:hypothetical protein